MNTINISLPKSLYRDAKRKAKEKGYSSISELVRDGLRRVIYPELTENGFTHEFEDMVLEAAKEPVDKSKIIETDEDLENWFTELHKKVEANRHAKNN